MTLPFKGYIYITLLLAILGVGWWIYNLYRDREQLQQEKAKVEQNAQALKDSINQLADSLTSTAVYVRDLNNALQKKTATTIALSAKILAYIDSLHDKGQAIIFLTGDTVNIRFAGEKGIADYSGYTSYNPKDDKASWDINITFPRPIGVGTELGKEQDGIWRYKVWSLTPGVKVKGNAVLDDKTYMQLQKYEPPKNLNRFLIGPVLGYYAGLGAGYLIGDNWALTTHYTFINGRDKALENVHVSIFYRPF